MQGLISTCINIILAEYAQNMLLSFGFIGANDENENPASQSEVEAFF